MALLALLALFVVVVNLGIPDLPAARDTSVFGGLGAKLDGTGPKDGLGQLLRGHAFGGIDAGWVFLSA